MVTVAMLLAAGCATPPGNMTAPLAELAAHEKSLDAIWTGYRPSERSYGVFRPAGGVLLLHRDGRPEGFRPLSEWREVDELAGIAWYRERPVDGLVSRFHVNLDVSGVTATFLRDPEGSGDLDTLIHEDFHGYQDERFAGERVSTMEYLDFGDAPLDELMASMLVEGALLEQALERDGGDRRQSVFNYIGLRWNRESRLPSSFVKAERVIETHEGTATWVAERALNLVSSGGTADLNRRYRERLRTMAASLGKIGVTQFLRARLYASGAALAELLEREYPGRWQSRVQDDGWTLMDTLVELSGADPDRLDKRGTRLRESPLFNSVLARVRRADLAEDLYELRESVLSGRPWSVEIRLPGTLNEDGADTGELNFSAEEAIPLPQGGLLIAKVRDAQPATDLASMNITGPPFLKGDPVRDESAGAGDSFYMPITVFTREAPRGPRGPMAAGTHRIDAGDLELDGVSVESDVPLTVVVRERPR